MTTRALFDAAFTIPDPDPGDGSESSGSSGYFLSDEFYVRYQWGKRDLANARQEGTWAAFGRITHLMPGLPDDYSHDLDAACGYNPRHIYLIKNGMYIVYDFQNKQLQQSVPQPVCGPDNLFGGVPAGFTVTSSVAFDGTGDSGTERQCYLFSGRQVYRCGFDSGSADGPYDIADLWPLLTRGGFGERVDYALPNPDSSTLYLFGNNGTSDTYAETDPHHTAGDGTTGRNQRPTSFNNDDWHGMRQKVFTEGGGFYPHGNMRLTAQLWGAGGGAGGAGADPGGKGGGGAYLSGVLTDFHRGEMLNILVPDGGLGGSSGQVGSGGGGGLAASVSGSGRSLTAAGGGGGGGYGGPSRDSSGNGGGDGGAGGWAGATRAHGVPETGSLHPGYMGAGSEDGQDGVGTNGGRAGRGDGTAGSPPGSRAGGYGGAGGLGSRMGGAGAQGGGGPGTSDGDRPPPVYRGGGGGAGGGSNGDWENMIGLGGNGQQAGGTDRPGYTQFAGRGGEAGQAGCDGVYGSGQEGLIILTW